jgi:SAM-dependent methyltransferase
MVRVLVYELLVHGLGASSAEVDFERPVPEVHGRIDALLGRTVFEFKSDLRREWADAERKLPDYLSQRERETGEHFVGIATDGATFIPYELRDGHLRRLADYTTAIERPRELLVWLGSAVAISAELDPTPDIVRRELGRESLAWQVAQQDLKSLWVEASEHPAARLKRDLWARLLERVYGSPMDADTLFFQHTYLSIIAKTMALHVIDLDMPSPQALLGGQPFREAGISGAVEADFFDWVLSAQHGTNLVHRIALQAGQFKLRDVQTDVLKGLYESLIDPEQRHDLGEYYTPDWLASRMCLHAIDRPLEQRVLDPACGSGTFLFHAVRRFLAAAHQSGLSSREALEQVTSRVLGVDVHPVAIQIARVTFLLALGPERLQDRPPYLAIPVYLGDSLQWNTRGFLAQRDVLIEVPDCPHLLEFPFEVARDPARFDAVIERMLLLSQQGAPAAGLESWLQREYSLGDSVAKTLARTYETLRDLHQAGRDHIWGFVARNLARPVWLSQEDQRADVVIGNPPWLPYRFMNQELQVSFREECQRCGLWTGGRVATHQDLSGYFFVRCVELYLKSGGLIAFVMPYAAMSRQQFEGFRSGVFAQRRGRARSIGAVQTEDRTVIGVQELSTGTAVAVVQFTEGWALSDDVQPLFPVPSCVLFARSGQGARGGALPAVLAAAGELPQRDASSAEAEARLEWHEAPWPSGADENSSRFPYRDEFRQGATIVPRALFVVENAPAGSLGINPALPVVQSRRTSQEKAPWKDLPVRDAHRQGIPLLRGNVEAQFVRPLLLGESVAPFRLLQSVLSVIPWNDDNGILMDSLEVQQHGYLHLADWLHRAESLWDQHRRSTMNLTQQIDYYGKVSAQFPVSKLRVAYAASGTLPAVAIVRDERAVVEHALYWTAPATEEEALYLEAVMNSETARERAEHLQARGQWGARHFDKVMLSLPIPKYDTSEPLHRELAQATRRAETVAASVPLQSGMHFVTARRRIRDALWADGVSREMDNLVAQLLV